MRKKTVFILSTSFAIVVGIFLLGWLITHDTPTYKIAYIGRYVGENDDDQSILRSQNFNFLHTHILKGYLNKFSKQHDFSLEMEIYDNHKNPDSTNHVYQRIIKDSTIIAVIDNSWGSEIIGAQNTIRQSKIPIIAINGDLNGLDYGNTLFTGNSDNQVADIVKFINKGLDADTVNFIYESNYALTKKYLDAFELNSIVVIRELKAESSKLHESEIDSADLVELLSNDHLTIINTHSELGSYVLDFANTHFESETFVGHASIISNESLISFRNANELIILSQSENAVPKSIASDIIEFDNSHPNLGSFNTALFIRRCKDAWSIIEQSIDKSDEPTRDNLTLKIQSYKDGGLDVEYDILVFDEWGSLIRENVFVQYDKTGEKAYSLQMNSNWQVIPNMSLGIEIIDIQDIDLSSNSFAADFFYWITSDSSFQNIEEFITFENIKPSESEIELVTNKSFGGLDYKLYKVSGIFFENYNEINYPFDDQEIAIDIQVLNTAERLRVSFDQESFDQNVRDFSLKGWEQNSFYVTVDNKVTDRLKGNLELDNSEVNKFKNISFRFNVSRSRLPGILQIFLPLLFIGILSIALLYLKNLNFSNIGEPLAAVFLTVIAYSISLSDITPTGSVLTKTDYLFILTLFVVVASFIIGLLHNTSKPILLRTVVIARYALTIIYLLSFVLIGIINLN